MYFLNFLFCEKRQGLEPHFFFGVVPDQTSCGAITTMHGCVLGHPGRHSPYDPLQRCPLQMFFSVRAPSHSLQNAAFLLTHFSFGGKVVGFFDPIITSCRPSECTKHICGGCSHTQVRHIFSHAECPECGCGKVFDDACATIVCGWPAPTWHNLCCPCLRWCRWHWQSSRNFDLFLLTRTSSRGPPRLHPQLYDEPSIQNQVPGMANWGDVAVHVVWQPRMLRLTEPLRGHCEEPHPCCTTALWARSRVCNIKASRC